MMSATTWLPQENRSGAAARRFVSEQLRQWRYRGPYDDVLIVTTELVSNALRHAHSAVVIQLSLDHACLRLQVGDDSPAEPVRRMPDADGGYGLNIVNQVCTRWGVEHVAGGKIVWCECPTELTEPSVSLARSTR
jgi:anti-sigma regulatory factor (Ser/Thr protein kinase)